MMEVGSITTALESCSVLYRPKERREKSGEEELKGLGIELLMDGILLGFSCNIVMNRGVGCESVCF